MSPDNSLSISREISLLIAKFTLKMCSDNEMKRHLDFLLTEYCQVELPAKYIQ